jgi:hypothetical protein
MLEGGGQILRNATALAAITHQNIAIDRIRAGNTPTYGASQTLCALSTAHQEQAWSNQLRTLRASCSPIRLVKQAMSGHFGGPTVLQNLQRLTRYVTRGIKSLLRPMRLPQHLITSL